MALKAARRLLHGLRIPKKIAVGMSGGVDSGVAAYILKQQGHRVVGVHMSNWDASDEWGYCTGEQDLQSARAVCKHLDVPLYEASFIGEYWTLVFQELLDGLERGVTPNPDVLCNRYIKFDKLLNYSRERLGAEFLAMGHYARIHTPPGGREGEIEGASELWMARDTDKDQSYFLSRVREETLKHVLLPLANLDKQQVREIARKAGLPNADRRSSVGICMVGRRKFDQFISGYLDERPGWFVDLDGHKIAPHKGIHLWTIGQRAKVSGKPEALYVVHRDVFTNQIFLCEGNSHESLYARKLVIGNCNWFSSANLSTMTSSSETVRVRARHQMPLAIAEVSSYTEGTFLVELSEDMYGPAEGQAVSFYDLKTDVCLGGGEIFGVLDREESYPAIAACKATRGRMDTPSGQVRCAEELDR